MDTSRKLPEFELNTDIEEAVALLDHPRSEPKFSLQGNRFLAVKSNDRRQRRGIRAFIRPENAAALLEYLPSPGDRTHGILRGDFVLCDIIPAIIAKRGGCPHLRIATLGLSVSNADTLAMLVERGHVERLTLVVSHYFQQVDKATVYRGVESRLRGLAEIIVTRCHAKVICLPNRSGDFYVVEGSANLRSSDNVEQIVITNDRDTHDFHVAWMEEISRG